MQLSEQANTARQFVELEDALRDRLASDPQRPAYHFLPPANWLNDPNGVIHWQGQYHLFYQYNPNGPFWGTIHWGHGVSNDLIHWTHLPMALLPTPDSPDADGCWSGYAINNDGVPTLIYTGLRGHEQSPCLATSQDNLVSWQKYSGNPIIPAPPADLELRGFRDHCVWQEDGVWYQLIGTGFKDGGGAVLLYTSPDLLHWQYLHPLYSGDFDRPSETWECPDFFRLGDTQVLMISSEAQRQVVYYTGTYRDRRFHPLRQGQVDLGGRLYAPQSLLDEQGRRIMWGWLQEGRSLEAQHRAGWSGVMTLPLLLTTSPAGYLKVDFAPEVQNLRGVHHERTDLTVGATDFESLEMSGDCLEIEVQFEPGDATEFGLVLRRDPDGSEQTRLVYEPQSQRLSLDCRQSSLDPTARGDIEGGLCRLASDGSLTLHLMLDRSVIELTANHATYMSGRLYPTRPDSLAVGLFAKGGSVRVKRLDVWEMGSIW